MLEKRAPGKIRGSRQSHDVPFSYLENFAMRRKLYVISCALSAILFVAVVYGWVSSYRLGTIAGIRFGPVAAEVATAPGVIGLTLATGHGEGADWLDGWTHSSPWGTSSDGPMTTTFRPRTLDGAIAGFGVARRAYRDFAGNSIKAYAIQLPGWFVALVLAVLPVTFASQRLLRKRYDNYGTEQLNENN